MIELYIKNQLVELGDDFSFTFEFENPFFTDCSNSTLDIYIPLEGSRNNLKIFGPLCRYDVTKRKESFPALLYDKGQLKLNGTAIVNQVTNTGLKVQLVSGNSEINFRGNNDVYIDEMELDDIGKEYIPGKIWLDISKTTHMAGPEKVKAMYMPCVTGDDISNRIYINVDGKGYQYQYRDKGCIQPYLSFVMDCIVRKMGYTVGQNDILNTEMRYLYVCNNKAGTSVNKALPHWTVCEFLDEIEKFCSVVTVVDEINKSVDFIDKASYFKTNEYEMIDQDDILEDFDVRIADKSNEKDVSTGNVGYALPSLAMNNFYCLADGIIDNAEMKEYPDIDKLTQGYLAMTPEDRKRYIYKDNSTGRYHISYQNEIGDILLEVDTFKMLKRKNYDSADVEMKIVPACMKYYNIGLWDSRDPGMRHERKGDLLLLLPEVSTDRKTEVSKIHDYQKAIENNEISVQRTTKDKMEVAFNYGYPLSLMTNSKTYNVPAPFTDRDQRPTYTNSGIVGTGSLSLDGRKDSIGERIKLVPKFNSNVAYTFRFRMRHNIDVRKKFIIANQEYVCEKLEADVNIDGFSEIAEGVFYKM